MHNKQNSIEKSNSINGWLIINKPKAITSAKVVSIVKKQLGVKKVGHAGTLDPLATGVLPLALGEATKTVSYVMANEKEYEFTVKWGQATDTDDSEGQVIDSSDVLPSEDQIKNVLHNFIGQIQQVPPSYSAIKVNGKRAYSMARQGEDVKLMPRNVDIFDLKLLKANKDTASFKTLCGKGTYVRSLARDIALKLGTLGHIVELKRTKVGKFCEKRAILLENVKEIVYKSDCFGQIIPIEEVLDDIPVLSLSLEQARAIRQGRTVMYSDSNLVIGDKLLLKSELGLVALGEFCGEYIKSLRVFNLNL